LPRTRSKATSFEPDRPGSGRSSPSADGLRHARSICIRTVIASSPAETRRRQHTWTRSFWSPISLRTCAGDYPTPGVRRARWSSTHRYATSCESLLERDGQSKRLSSRTPEERCIQEYRGLARAARLRTFHVGHRATQKPCASHAWMPSGSSRRREASAPSCGGHPVDAREHARHVALVAESGSVRCLCK